MSTGEGPQCSYEFLATQDNGSTSFQGLPMWVIGKRGVSKEINNEGDVHS